MLSDITQKGTRKTEKKLNKSLKNQCVVKKLERGIIPIGLWYIHNGNKCKEI